MKSELKSLFTQKELHPFTGHKDLYNVIYLMLLYVTAGAIIFFYPKFNNAFYIVTGVLLMGIIQHTLATFIHESAHFHMFQNKKWNDLAGHILCAAPLVSYLKDYRYFHFEHHRHTGKADRDPELKFYRAMSIKPAYSNRREVLVVFIKDLAGINYVKGLLFALNFFAEKRKQGIIENPTVLEHAAVMAWFTLIPFLMFKAGLLTPYLIFWILPILTLSPLLLRWHGFGEHVREINTTDAENTLTHRMSFLPTAFLYPLNSSFHLEHHLYPQLPWYQLKNFYKWARKNPVYASQSDHLTVDGFFLGEKSVISVTFPIEN